MVLQSKSIVYTLHHLNIIAMSCFVSNIYVQWVSRIKPILFFIHYVFSEHKVDTLAFWRLGTLLLHLMIVIKTELSIIIHWLG